MLGLTTHRSMLLGFGGLVIVFLAISNLLSAFTVWLRQKIAASMDHNISMKLVGIYVDMPYQFFLQHDTSTIIKKVVTDVGNLVDGVLIAGSQLICQLVVSLAIFALLFFFKPFISLFALVMFAGIYGIIYYNKRSYLADLGEKQLSIDRARFRSFVDLVSGIKAIKSDGAKDYFVKRHELPSREYSQIAPQVTLISTVPRYLVETLAFGGVVCVTLYVVAVRDNFIESLPGLTMFALAGYRLIPALNSVYASLTQVVKAYPAIDYIYDDLYDTLDREKVEPVSIEFDSDIRLSEVSFRYEGSDEVVVSNVSLGIPKGSRAALVGPSGSGKTTLFDIIMGLLSPDSGTVLVDNSPVDASARASWQSMIGYVPQGVFLYDATVAKNVAFGSDTPDMERVRASCKAAQIDSFIEEQLADGYETLIGERGVRLSGGQRQRLGLARALYRQPQVLMLDEATSALDNVTEEQVVQAIYNEFPGVTILMIAHRISTVQNCDRLYVMDRGKLIAQGSYQELLESNKLFRDLASVS